jgi:AbrB family transcriptional regulator, transcriptional pleiotropic regulator of transition state genes
MKSTGIVRQVENLGRIVLPMEQRKSLKIDTKNPIAIYVEDNAIILKKCETAYIFCGQAREYHYSISLSGHIPTKH